MFKKFLSTCFILFFTFKSPAMQSQSAQEKLNALKELKTKTDIYVQKRACLGLALEKNAYNEIGTLWNNFLIGKVSEITACNYDFTKQLAELLKQIQDNHVAICCKFVRAINEQNAELKEAGNIALEVFPHVRLLETLKSDGTIGKLCEEILKRKSQGDDKYIHKEEPILIFCELMNKTETPGQLAQRLGKEIEELENQDEVKQKNDAITLEELKNVQFDILEAESKKVNLDFQLLKEQEKLNKLQEEAAQLRKKIDQLIKERNEQ